MLEFLYIERGHLHILARRHIHLTRAVILSSSSNFFATIAKKVQNLTYVYVFLPVLFTLTDLSGTMLFISIMIDN